ncbi:spermidine/putrescine ABC transporter substrate-binding protein [Pseudomonadota bacterium]
MGLFQRWVLLAALACLPFSIVAAQNELVQKLVVLSWPDYIDPDLVEEFERTHHAKIKWVYFESDDVRDNILVSSKTEGIDVVVVNDSNLKNYRSFGWLAPLTAKHVPSLKHTNARWLTEFEGADGYSLPYFWGTLGIAYRQDLISDNISSWMHLFKPQESLRGKIVMMGGARDVIGMALKALGYSANSKDRKQLDNAEALLTSQKAYVDKYAYVAITEESALVSGEVLMSMAYNGDVLTLNRYEPNIKYVLPSEGGNLWVDYLVVMQSSNKKNLAMSFVDFINQPENAARNAAYVYYATPNDAAKALMTDEYLNNGIIYPSEAQITRSEMYKELPSRVLKTRNRIMADLIK